MDWFKPNEGEIIVFAHGRQGTVSARTFGLCSLVYSSLHPVYDESALELRYASQMYCNLFILLLYFIIILFYLFIYYKFIYSSQ